MVSALGNDPQRFLERTAKIQWGIMVCVFGLSHAPALILLDLPRFGGRGAFLLFFLVMAVAGAQIAQEIASRINAATANIDVELRRANEASERNASTGNMRNVLADIRAMQSRFEDASTGNRMQEMIDAVDAGHRHMSDLLTQALGHIQFHDVMRQRVEQSQEAMLELDEHLQAMANPVSYTHLTLPTKRIV